MKKSILSYPKLCYCLLLLLLEVLLLTPQQGMAKVKIKTRGDLIAGAGPAGTGESGVSDSDIYPGRSFLYCDGHTAYILADEKGRTQVYVEDDKPGICEENRVDLEEYGIEWKDVVIVGGCESGTCSSSYILMYGGHVQGIVLSGQYGSSQKTSTLNASGGSAEFIHVLGNAENDTISGYLSIYLENFHYTGSTKIRVGNKAPQTTLYINTNCFFPNESARFAAADLTEFRSAIVPSPTAWSTLMACGKYPTVPSRHASVCDRFEDYGIYSLYVSDTLKINKCNGWYSAQGREVTNYPKVVMPKHSIVVSPIGR